MPSLKNQRHEMFAQGIANGKPPTEAYENAGYSPHPPSASRLLTNAKIASRVEELTKLINERAVGSLVLTREYILGRIQEIADAALEAGQYTPALNATVKLGEEACGMFVTKTKAEVTVEDVTKQAEIKDRLKGDLKLVVNG